MEYFDIDYSDIHLIKDLWEKNRIYHEVSSEHFGHAYKGICFEDRMKKFKTYEGDTLKITLCKENEVIIGYCISSACQSVGELVSMHVDASKRGKGIGKKLVKHHLSWMKELACQSIGVTVSQENESTIAFYKKMGFYPNTLYMQQL
ncbi:GNAT family N-acetyltransferase [Fusibacter sp. JL216-2]|uniref:GNAT family N-acetyltransferase n=1 Tax=Fusibacter sp. JL216-2 TaxID=3071453 RepID=UPI003D34CADE